MSALESNISANNPDIFTESARIRKSDKGSSCGSALFVKCDIRSTDLRIGSFDVCVVSFLIQEESLWSWQ